MSKLRESLRTLERFTKKAVKLRRGAVSESQRALLDSIVDESLALQSVLWQLTLELDENMVVACEILP